MTALDRVWRAIDNPLIVKDGVSRMRSWRAPLVVTLYLGLLGSFGYAIYALTLLIPTGQRYGSAQIGANVFQALAFFQISLVSLFAPALAAGAISGERERQTFDVLLVSRVTAAEIVWGKLVASIAYMLLLVLTALPLFAAVFLFGGIDFEQFLLAQVLTVSTAVAIGSVSLFLSAVFRRSLPATVTSYAAAFAGMVGTLVAGQVLTLVAYSRGGGFQGGGPLEIHPLLFGNPLYAMYIVLNNPNGTPVQLGRLVQLMLLVPGRPARAGPALEPWQLSVLFELALIALSIAGSVLLVRGRRAPQPRRAPIDEPENQPEPAKA